VHLDEASSWRFGSSSSGLAHHALYVRDALGLTVPSAERIPPHLTDVTPDRSDLLGPGELAAAAAEWPRWWSSILAHELGDQDSGEPASLARRRLEAVQSMFEATGFAQLHRASTALLADRGARSPEGRTRQQRRLQFRYSLVRDTVHKVAAQAAVEPGEIAGRVVILDVTGGWACRPAPGAGVCSAAVAEDPEQAGPFLWRVFMSQVLS
jgi:hypothetical protein